MKWLRCYARSDFINFLLDPCIKDAALLFAWNRDDVRREVYGLAPHFLRIIYVANIIR